MFRCAFVCLIISGITGAAPNINGSASDLNIEQSVFKVITDLGSALEGTENRTFNFYGKTNIFVIPNQPGPRNSSSVTTPKGSPKNDTKTVVEPIARNKTYHVSNAKSSWIEAYQWCKIFKMNLACIKSEAENARVVAAIKQRNVADEYFWLGAVDVELDGTYKWVTDDEALNYKNWKAHQPDHFQGLEHCVEIVASSGQWNDVNCYEKRFYVCEKEE